MIFVKRVVLLFNGDSIPLRRVHWLVIPLRKNTVAGGFVGRGGFCVDKKNNNLL